LDSATKVENVAYEKSHGIKVNYLINKEEKKFMILF
jgi:hypothetical protein